MKVVQIVETQDTDTLGNLVNEWLELKENRNIEIIDIKFTSAMTYDSNYQAQNSEGCIEYQNNAFILYEPKEKGKVN